MCKDNVVIQISSGLETRPIAKLVQVASQYRSTISLESGTRRVNAKSIMNIMAACIKCGTVLTVKADGEDEQAALDKAVELIESGLGDPE